MAVTRSVRIKICCTGNFCPVYFSCQYITKGIYVKTANNNNFKDTVIEVEHTIIAIVAFAMFVSVFQSKRERWKATLLLLEILALQQ